MKVKYIGEYYQVSLTKGAVYDVVAVERGWYRIVDATGEDYLFPPEEFEIVEIDPVPPTMAEAIARIRTYTIDDRTTYSVVCSHCAHFDPALDLEWRCKAFDRVPDAIWEGKIDHTAEYPGDHGIRFTPRAALPGDPGPPSAGT